MTFPLYAIIPGAFFLIWALLVWFFAGEKYMKWSLRYHKEGNYDLKRFKLVHSLMLVYAGAVFFLTGSLWETKSYIPLGLIAVGLIIRDILTDKYCRKPESKD